MQTKKCCRDRYTAQSSNAYDWEICYFDVIFLFVSLIDFVEVQFTNKIQQCSTIQCFDKCNCLTTTKIKTQNISITSEIFLEMSYGQFSPLNLHLPVVTLSETKRSSMHASNSVLLFCSTDQFIWFPSDTTPSCLLQFHTKSQSQVILMFSLCACPLNSLFHQLSSQ